MMFRNQSGGVEKLKNKAPYYSIIVTAYNIEKYITTCIESIKGQTFENYECIVVDDGSDDKTDLMINKAIAGDSHFVYFKTAHFGQAHARNTGLKVSRGKYVLFADGDDTLIGNCLSACKEKAEACDMLIFGINYQEYGAEKRISEWPLKIKAIEFSSGSKLIDWYVVNYALPSHSASNTGITDDLSATVLLNSAANKVYKRSVLEKSDIHFDENVAYGEDRIFNFDFLRVSGKIKVLPDIYYNYRRINPSSITQKFRSHSIDQDLYLHDLKMRCILELLKNTAPSELEAFERFDLDCAIRHALRHIKDHTDILSKDVLADEYRYLTSRILVNNSLQPMPKTGDKR